MHGKHVHLLSKKIGEEYVFITSTNQVFPETCETCKDLECPYNFNMSKLLKYTKIRKKVLKYVFDASFDDMLLEYGVIPVRNVPVLRETVGDTLSKPTYTEKNGKKLLKLDKKALQLRGKYFKSMNNYYAVLKKMKKCPDRVIIKRKDRRRVKK